ncbi:MAG: SDR family NAD(P)-dependent oxidoreductase [Desulfatibacillaceae bacterium]
MKDVADNKRPTDFAGVAMVTGGAAGLGSELVRQLAARGGCVLAVDRDRQGLDRLVSESAGWKGRVDALACDLARPGAAEELLDRCDSLGLRVDTLVNNAADALYGETVEMDVDRLAGMLLCNGLTLTLLCRLFGERMAAAGGGRIMNVSSIAGYQPAPLIGAYAATKTYIRYLSRALARELSPAGVQVTCFLPGMLRTELMARAGMGHTKFYKRSLSAGMAPEQAARHALKAMDNGGGSVIPGVGPRVQAAMSRMLPDMLVARASRRMMT